MISKSTVKKLVQTHAPNLIKSLGIKCVVDFYIEHSQSKKYKRRFKVVDSVFGFTSMVLPRTAEVVILYNEHHSEKEALSTLIHELLHVRFSIFTNLLPKKSGKVRRHEEDLVRQLEKLLIKLYWRKIKDGK